MDPPPLLSLKAGLYSSTYHGQYDSLNQDQICFTWQVEFVMVTPVEIPIDPSSDFWPMEEHSNTVVFNFMFIFFIMYFSVLY